MIYPHIEKITIEILKSHKLLKAPINVNKLAQKLGIEVKKEDFNDDISGLFILQNNTPQIILNKRESSNENRERFTISHEIGHYVLHSTSKQLFIDKSPRIHFRDKDSSTGDILKEKEANSFAASLLMPKELISHEISNNTSRAFLKDPISFLSNKFEVSQQAMTYRLINLGYDIL